MLEQYDGPRETMEEPEPLPQSMEEEKKEPVHQPVRSLLGKRPAADSPKTAFKHLFPVVFQSQLKVTPTHGERFPVSLTFEEIDQHI